MVRQQNNIIAFMTLSEFQNSSIPTIMKMPSMNGYNDTEEGDY
jgi:hypothetical protein